MFAMQLVVAVAGSDPLALVQERLVRDCTAGVDMGAAAKWLAMMNPNGTWSDVNYSDVSRTPWSPQKHISRVATMSCAARRSLDAHTPRHDTPGAYLNGLNSTPYLNASLLALDVWLSLDPKSLNWWYDDIGAPGAMANVSIALGVGVRWLSAAQLAGCERVMLRAKDPCVGDPCVPMTGANLVWETAVLVRLGVVERNASLVNESLQRIWAAARVATDQRADGIQVGARL
jgi:chondroitin AC lyase